MAGQAVKLQLADKVFEEQRHHNISHFRFSNQKHDHYDGNVRNDFHAYDSILPASSGYSWPC